MINNDKIFVTRPSLPALDNYIPYLKDLWNSKRLTNNGKYHQEFEEELSKFLDVPHCNLFSNGTLALLVGLTSLRVTGEVITTPFSFVATTHALNWNGITPVFCDIDRETLNLDPQKIESLITPQTTAILPVHVYGHPCDVEAIEEIANIYGLKVIYDAAHAFGIQVNGEPIAKFGDLSILSFHATKVFNTIEGGAIVCNDENLKKRIDYLKNFGFVNETTVVGIGINAKMNELQAALGLLQLQIFNEEVRKRKLVAERYSQNLDKLEGLSIFYDPENIIHNYSYFPILIDPLHCGKTRDDIYLGLKEHEIHGRRYFYPLISHFPPYRNLPTATKTNLPVAEEIAEKVLCLPIYGELDLKDVDRISEVIIKILRTEK